MTQQTNRPRRPDNRPPTRAEKRKQWREEALRAAAARKRRNAIFGTVGSLLVVALLGALVFWVVNRDGDDPAGEQAGAPNASARAGEGGFPELPPGADPALGTKPSATGGCAGITELTPTTLIKGTGPAAQAGQQITVNYVGVSCQTGEEFDASWKRSQPFDFQLGGGNVIEGWDKGLVGVTVGSRVQLDIPSKMAYGDDASGGRPTGPLRFVVDVLKVG